MTLGMILINYLWLFVIILLGGAALGSVITYDILFKYRNSKTYGNVIIDMTSPEKDVITMEYSKDPLSMVNEDYIVFDVLVKS